MRLLPE